jgi:hypothetical protein
MQGVKERGERAGRKGEVPERGKGARLGCEKTEKQKLLEEEKEKKRGRVFIILDIYCKEVKRMSSLWTSLG